MPSHLHEALIELFRHRPALAAELAECVGIKLPGWHHARPDSGELPDLIATRLADAVTTLSDADDRPVLAIVIEVQLRPDPDKRWVGWPAYVANLRARLRCPVLLLVVCADTRTANWCATPIELGPGSVVTP